MSKRLLLIPGSDLRRETHRLDGMIQRLTRTGLPLDLPLELLRPGLALPRLAAGTSFQLLAGNVAVADGKVLQHGA